jgi:hypothetical protein
MKIFIRIRHMLSWMTRDKDITYYEEFHYIYITIRELIEVIKTKNRLTIKQDK